ncbi:zinc-binding metallopeptidase family protein [Zunongwangia endophytica]|uniref:Zinc-binding metallopeptidase n=1 Tax=Zunongwangia endophytica TaxID=1808945 RepID=A0ABV8H788_9FLAO|nr:putative zinc-binding metallopeptidase [Zunongwangia endophytica]MDN3594699.1 putative zinc-binding metallopeptidase [Zunongwangia endophytica]
MKTFSCSACDNLVFFENETCEFCGNKLGYWSAEEVMLSVEEEFRFNSKKLQYCRNHKFEACNWLIDDSAEDSLCESCQLNDVIPNLDNPKRLLEWQKVEFAKHRLIYSLKRLGLPFSFNLENGEKLQLQFKFLAPDIEAKNGRKLLTGHLSGLITLNVDEADDAKREAMRMQMGEKMRTLLGHFRHEIGHFYWEAIVLNDAKILNEFREIFGDDQKDYGEALNKYYENGPKTNWKQFHITKYASAHAWEDWAETWAHYFHIMDTLETAYYYGLEIQHPVVSSTPEMSIRLDPYSQKDFDKIIDYYISLTLALNSLNRGMGLSDIYPFILSKIVIKKLKFIHNLIRNFKA